MVSENQTQSHHTEKWHCVDCPASDGGDWWSGLLCSRCHSSLRLSGIIVGLVSATMVFSSGSLCAITVAIVSGCLALSVSSAFTGICKVTSILLAHTFLLTSARILLLAPRSTDTYKQMKHLLCSNCSVGYGKFSTISPKGMLLLNVDCFSLV